MKKISLLLYSLLYFSAGFAQYKNDNVLYKTVFTADLCKELNKHPGQLILDVRSPGEYMDTSTRGMNIGHIKNAVNIEVNELGNRISSINAYKDKPVFVYCSHSQRSRRASKMLADSGFTQVYNINEGLTGIRQFPHEGNDCLYDQLETRNDYNIISPVELCSKIAGSAKDIFLLDVRPDSAFKHISTDLRENAFGHFKNSTNIPLTNLEANLQKVPAGKEIIIIDLFGNDAARAAELLKKASYPKVTVLLEGINRLLNTNKKELPCLGSEYISILPYKIINAQELKAFAEASKDFLFLDARTTEEYNNQHKNTWQNLGHLKDAVNIPLNGLEGQTGKIEKYKNKPIIIYVFSSGKEAHEAAAVLIKKGFTKIYVLQGGIFNIGWTAANIKGYSSLAKFRVDIPEEN